ncbi:MAG: ACP S-malonyltransferase [Spirochaetales bacterium]|jgi:trans-AT polyketide synthase, acyltransferase and oxidoreductase domains|nr:ACP S-malonyltransferase [Spirochaetales bacterium]
MNKIYVFPGQGSQAVGMGGELFDKYADLIEKADQILGYSLKTLCLEDPEGILNQTQFTQPALFAVNSLMYLEKKDETGTPDFVAGHSLGEYAALFAAGAFDFETGVRLVQKRGELMGKAKGGGMAAVIGLGPDKVREILDASGIDTIDVANFNSPKQVILSGLTDDLEKAAAPFTDGGARRFLLLKVSAAFHSRYMADAGEAFTEFLDSVSFNDLEFPVIANVTAKPYENGKIKENLGQQITSSVRWQESVEYLLSQGECEFVEIGPGSVLAKLVQQIRG